MQKIAGIRCVFQDFFTQSAPILAAKICAGAIGTSSWSSSSQCPSAHCRPPLSVFFKQSPCQGPSFVPFTRKCRFFRPSTPPRASFSVRGSAAPHKLSYFCAFSRTDNLKPTQSALLAVRRRPLPTPCLPLFSAVLLKRKFIFVKTVKKFIFIVKNCSMASNLASIVQILNYKEPQDGSAQNSRLQIGYPAVNLCTDRQFHKLKKERKP